MNKMMYWREAEWFTLLVRLGRGWECSIECPIWICSMCSSELVSWVKWRFLSGWQRNRFMLTRCGNFCIRSLMLGLSGWRACCKRRIADHLECLIIDVQSSRHHCAEMNCDTSSAGKGLCFKADYVLRNWGDIRLHSLKRTLLRLLAFSQVAAADWSDMCNMWTVRCRDCPNVWKGGGHQRRGPDTSAS